MDENRVEGTARNLGGKVQDAVGGLTGDQETQARGKVNQVRGNLQNTYGQAADQARDTAGDIADIVRSQPMTALLVAGGVGFLLGLLRG